MKIMWETMTWGLFHWHFLCSISFIERLAMLGGQNTKRFGNHLEYFVLDVCLIKHMLEELPS